MPEHAPICQASCNVQCASTLYVNQTSSRQENIINFYEDWSLSLDSRIVILSLFSFSPHTRGCNDLKAHSIRAHLTKTSWMNFVYNVNLSIWYIILGVKKVWYCISNSWPKEQFSELLRVCLLSYNPLFGLNKIIISS